MKEIVLNMNDEIFVELFPGGWDYIKQNYEELFDRLGEFADKLITDGINLYKRRTNKYIIGGKYKELTRFQLHEFMQLFGPKIRFGLPNELFHNDIYLTVDETTKYPNEFDEKENNFKVQKGGAQ